MADAKDQIMIYIRGGDPFTTKVPLGSYYVRAASGNTWYGEDDLFGPNTAFFKLNKSADDRAFRFTQQSCGLRCNRIIGNTIIFRGAIDGTMREEGIRRDEF